MTPAKRAALLIAFTAVAPLTSAIAADYDPPIIVDTAEEYVPVEVGSGWYLRGDIAYVTNEESINNASAYTPAAFSSSEDPVFGSIGMGYHFSDYLRADINIGYMPGFSQSISLATPTVNGASQVDNHSWTGMLNGYVDLGTYIGFTPYVGAGIGLVQSNYELNGFYRDATTNVNFSDDQSEYSMAYSLAAGVAYNVSKNVAIDVGYQYIKAPDAKSISIRNLNTFPVEEGMESHQVKVGVRYDLW